MDFTLNRLERLEKYLDDFSEFVSELNAADSEFALEIQQKIKDYSLQQKLEIMHKDINMLKSRIDSGHLVEKSGYLKLLQMREQHDKLKKSIEKHFNIKKYTSFL